MKAFDVETLVPGHGDVATHEQFETMLDYLNAILARAESAFYQGKSIDEIAEIPAEYINWNWAHVYKGNLASIYRQLKEKTE
jgi:hypothetical protein